MDTTNYLTMGGFVALVGLLLSFVGASVALARSNAQLSERIARLEEWRDLMSKSGS